MTAARTPGGSVLPAPLASTPLFKGVRKGFAPPGLKSAARASDSPFMSSGQPTPGSPDRRSP